MGMYYDRQGQPLELLEWAKKLEKKDYKIVKQTELKNGKWVSSVWLGLDHRFGDEGAPLIFETMVFSSKEDFGELDCMRYSTEEDALKGHDEMIAKYDV